MEQTLPSNILPWRVLGAWADLQGATRAELDRSPSEGRVLFYVMLAGLFWFLGRYALLTVGPISPAFQGDEFNARVASDFVSSMFYRTLALYVLAAIAGLAARLAGGSGGWYDTRVAVFWAALVAAPVMLASTFLSIILAGMPGMLADAASMLGTIAFAWAMSCGQAEAHGFRRVWLVFTCVAGLAGLFIASMLLLISVTGGLPT